MGIKGTLTEDSDRVSELYFHPNTSEDEIYERIAQFATERGVDKKSIDIDIELNAERCNICGRNVAPGSGWFVNRIPDLNTYEERIELGRKYPEGDFVCSACDSEGRDNEYKPWAELCTDERARVYGLFINGEDRNESARYAPKEEDVHDYYDDNIETFAFVPRKHVWVGDRGSLIATGGFRSFEIPLACSRCGLLARSIIKACAIRKKRQHRGNIHNVDQEEEEC